MKIWQLNTRLNDTCLDLLAVHALKSNVHLLMISDPPRSIKTGRRIQGFKIIMPDVNPEDIQSVILLKNDLTGLKVFSSCGRLTGVTLKLRNQFTTFISVYIRHTTGEGLSELFSVCEILRSRGYNRLFVAGDFNAKSYRWGPHNVSANRLGREVINWTDSHPYNVLNKFPCLPTFSGENGHKSWIDLTVASDDLVHLVESWRVLPLEEGLTDHNLVETLLDLDNLEEESSPVYLRNWKETDWTCLTLDVESQMLHSGWLAYDWDGLQNATALSNAIEEFSEFLMLHALKWVPQSGKNRQCNAWWNKDIASQHKKTKRAFRAKQKHFRKHGWIPDLLKEEAAKERNTLRKMIREEKRNLWKSFAGSCTETNMWKALRRVAPKRSSIDLSYIINENGEICQEYAQKADILAKKFFPANQRPILPEEREALDKNRAFLASKPEKHIPPITEPELARHIFKGNPYSCPGPDSIPNCLLRNCYPFLKETFLKIFNKCLQWQIHPVCWKKSHVVAIPKKNNEPRIGNLRPISLISTFSKTLEGLMCERISFVLERKEKLASTQYGFRTQKSVEQGLLRFQRSIEEGLSSSNVMYCCSLDVRSAFDLLSHQILISRAIDADLPYYMVAWIDDFMLDRQAVLALPEGMESISVRGSTPQGSPASPILFDLYFNDVLNIKRNNVEIQGFADDLLIWSSCHNDELARSALQDQLEAMDVWMKGSAMSFNTDKCYLIRFSKKPINSPVLPVKIANRDLPIVEEIKYLGVTFDAKLSFQSHIQKTAAKCFHKLQELRRLATRTWGVESDILQKLCMAIIEPSVYFGASIWGTLASRKGRLKPIEQLMRKVGIMVSGAFSTTSYPSVYWLSGFLPPTVEIGRRLVIQAFQLEAYGLVHEQWLDTHRGSLSSFVSRYDQEVKYEIRRIKRSSTFDGFPTQTQLLARSIPPWNLDVLPKPWTTNEKLEETDITIVLATHRSAHQVTCVLRSSILNLDNLSNSVPHSSNSLLEATCIWEILSSPEMAQYLHQRKARRLLIVSKSQKLLQLLYGIKNVYECVNNIQIFILEVLSQFGVLCFWSNPKASKMEPQFNNLMAKAQERRNTQNLDQKRNLHWTSSDRKNWIDRMFNPRWRQIYSDSTVGRDILDMQVQFRRGKSIVTAFPFERNDSSLLTQFISNHFSSKSYRIRFKLDTVADDLNGNPEEGRDFCECGLGPENRDHLMFHCLHLCHAREKLKKELDTDTLTSSDWKSIICNPEAFMEFIKEAQKVLLSKDRRWGNPERPRTRSTD